MNNNLKKIKIKTAVLLLVFNRPETTARVFEKIRQAKPPRLYIAGDGASNKDGEEEKNYKVRKIATNVDWRMIKHYLEIKILDVKKQSVML